MALVTIDSRDTPERTYEEWDAVFGAVLRDLAAAGLTPSRWLESDEGIVAELDAPLVSLVLATVSGRCAVTVEDDQPGGAMTSSEGATTMALAPAITVDVCVADPSGIPGYEFDPMSLLSDTDAVLTTDHPRSSYGLPVLVYKGHSYGPGDVRGVVLSLYNDTTVGVMAAARAAGWDVRPPVWTCPECGETASRDSGTVEHGYHRA